MNLQRDRQLGFSSMASGTLEIMLDRRNSWAQSITLELFNGVKDIFRNHLPVETTRKQPFVLSQDAVTPVSLFEFELRELFVEATVKSGCKWWCRTSERSSAHARFSRSLWSTRFVCRHSEKHYEKQAKDNSRNTRHILRCSCPASCVMKAISVMALIRIVSLCLHNYRLIRPTEGTNIWFFVTRPKLFSLDSCATLFSRAVLRPDFVREKSTYQIACVSLSFVLRMQHKQCFVQPCPA
jgi:hypothetical protein